MDLFFSNISNIGDAIGWMLIHFLWQGTLLFLGYWSITRLFLKNKINTQYWIGIFFITLCLIIPIREFFVQLGMTSTSNYTLLEQASLSFSKIRSAGLLNPTDLMISLIQKIIPYLVIFWAISVFLISSHLLKSWFSLIRISKEQSIQIPDFLIEKLKLANKQLKLPFKPRISISKKIDIPATFGYFKPIVLIPVSLINRIPQDQMEAILLHELCHIKRADFLHNIMQLLVETLFFYHPLTKWISCDIRKIREQCCDDLVLESKTNPLTYAKALTNIASIYNDKDTAKAKLNIQIAVNDGELFTRIKLLMLNKRPKSSITNIFFGLFFSTVVLFIFNKVISNNNQLPFNSGTSNQLFDNNKQAIRPEYTTPNIYDFLIAKPEPQQNKSKAIITNQNLPTKTESSKQKSTKQPTLNDTNITSTFITEKNNTINTFDQTDIEKNINNITNEIGTAENNLLTSAIPTDGPITNNVVIANNENTQESLKPKIRRSFPKVIKRVNPKLGINEQISGAEGTVILSFNIDRNGRVKKISVDKKSKLKILDSISRQALRKWQFDPQSINANNTNERYQQIFRFNLEEKQMECEGAVTGSRINRKQVCQQ